MNTLQNLKESTDLKLIENYQENQSAVYFGKLYQRFFSKIFRQACEIYKDREKAYDFTTNYFISLAKKITQLKDPNQILALMVIENKIYN